MKKIKNLWSDLGNWLKNSHSPSSNSSDSTPKATPEDLQLLEHQIGGRLPETYRHSLLAGEGGIQFENYKYLPPDEVYQCWKYLHYEKRSARSAPFRHPEGEDTSPEQGKITSKPAKNWVPIAVDAQRNYLCLNLHAAAHPSQAEMILLDASGDRKAFPHPVKEVNFGSGLQKPRLATARSSENPKQTATPSEKYILALKESKEIEELILAGEAEQLKEYLYTHKIPAKSYISQDYCLLRLAAQKKQTEVVRILLELGAEVNAGIRERNRSPLFEALWGTGVKQELIELLLAHGAQVNTLTTYQGSPLHAAVVWAKPLTINMLLKKGANTALQDAKGRRPVDLAQKMGKEKVVCLLETWEQSV